jgi:hypothetical protein
MSDSPWGPPIDVLPLLAREEQSLLAVLGGFAAEQWAAPVHDLAAHILGRKLVRLSRDRDDYRVDGSDEEWVLACRRLSPEVLFAMHVDVSAQIVDVWSRADADELGEPVPWAGPAPAPNWLATASDYAEYWVGQQRIREAAGVALLDQAEFLGPVVDTFMRGLPHALRDFFVAEGRQVTYTVSRYGAWTARYTEGRWVVERGAAGRSLASLATDAGTFWRLCTGDAAADRGQVKVTGDKDVAEAVLRMATYGKCTQAVR